MGFQTTTAISYDPHDIISIRRQVNKNKPFEHQEFEDLIESENWLDYPLSTQNEEYMQQGSTYPMKYDDDTHPNPLVIVPAPQGITPIPSHSEMTNKRDFSDAMETDHEDN